MFTLLSNGLQSINKLVVTEVVSICLLVQKASHTYMLHAGFLFIVTKVLFNFYMMAKYNIRLLGVSVVMSYVF